MAIGETIWIRHCGQHSWQARFGGPDFGIPPQCESAKLKGKEQAT
jgi:hypothetical protein